MFTTSIGRASDFSLRGKEDVREGDVTMGWRVEGESGNEGVRVGWV